jgi:hypothetical protein
VKALTKWKWAQAGTQPRRESAHEVEVGASRDAASP